MVTEIEIKAHVKEPAALKQLLHEKAEFGYSFEKSDTYYYMDAAVDYFPSGIRLRKEARRFPDRNEKCETFLTFKRKELKSNIEVNKETEFIIQPSFMHPGKDETAEDFGNLLLAAGFQIKTRKQKNGWAFHRDRMKIELLEVIPLGWFLELEIVKEHDEEANYQNEKQLLLDFISEIGINAEDIETRFYSELLALMGE